MGRTSRSRPRRAGTVGGGVSMFANFVGERERGANEAAEDGDLEQLERGAGEAGIVAGEGDAFPPEEALLEIGPDVVVDEADPLEGPLGDPAGSEAGAMTIGAGTSRPAPGYSPRMRASLQRALPRFRR